MILDAALEFSHDQALTVTADSTNTIDLTQPGDANEELFLVVKVGTAFTTGGAPSWVITLVTDDNSGFSSAATLFTSAAILNAAMTAGAELVKIRIPRGLEQFTKLVYTNGGDAATAGTVDAFLVNDVDHNNA